MLTKLQIHLNVTPMRKHKYKEFNYQMFYEHVQRLQ